MLNKRRSDFYLAMDEQHRENEERRYWDRALAIPSDVWAERWRTIALVRVTKTELQELGLDPEQIADVLRFQRLVILDYIEGLEDEDGTIYEIRNYIMNKMLENNPDTREVPRTKPRRLR